MKIKKYEKVFISFLNLKKLLFFLLYILYIKYKYFFRDYLLKTDNKIFINIKLYK